MSTRTRRKKGRRWREEREGKEGGTERGWRDGKEKERKIVHKSDVEFLYYFVLYCIVTL